MIVTAPLKSMLRDHHGSLSETPTHHPGSCAWHGMTQSVTCECIWISHPAYTTCLEHVEAPHIYGPLGSLFTIVTLYFQWPPIPTHLQYPGTFKIGYTVFSVTTNLYPPPVSWHFQDTLHCIISDYQSVPTSSILAAWSAVRYGLYLISPGGAVSGAAVREGNIRGVCWGPGSEKGGGGGVHRKQESIYGTYMI